MSLVRAKADADSRQSEEKKAAEKKRNIIVLAARFFMDLGYIETVRQIESDTNISLDRIDAADNMDMITILTEYEDFYEMRFQRKPKLTRRLANEDAVHARGSVKKEKDLDRKVSLPKLPPDGGSGKQASQSADHPQQNLVCRSESSPPAADGRKPRDRRSKSQNRDESVQRPRAESRPPLAPNSGSDQVNPEAAGGADAGGLDGLIVGGQNVAKVNADAKSKKEGGAVSHDDTPVPGHDQYDNQLLRALPNFGGDKEYRDLAINISRDILTRNPGVSWESIVGLGGAKALLKEAVVMPLRYPQLFTGLLSAWKGVLLFGPPGTGKTLLAKAVATECETTFFNISASTVVSKWRGDSEKLIRVLFDLARHHQPSTIFIDELDSLMSARGGGDGGGGEHEGSRRMKTELLIQMDGLLKDSKDQVFLLAASNLPWDLDSAMLRRLEKRVLVALPEPDARETMIRNHMPEGVCQAGQAMAEGLDYAKLATLTEEWSGSDIRLLCKEAAMSPLRRLMTEIESAERQAEERVAVGRGSNKSKAVEKMAPGASAAIDDLKMGPVTQEDVAMALEKVHRAPSAHLDKYEEWHKNFGAA